MSLITKKSKRRHRIQFTMACELHERYTSYQALAKKLGLVINFSHDFEEWFIIQMDKIGNELNKIEAEQAGENLSVKQKNSQTIHTDLNNNPATKIRTIHEISRPLI